MMVIHYPLPLRQVEDILFERGIDISREAIRYWWKRFGPKFAAEIRKRRVGRRLHQLEDPMKVFSELAAIPPMPMLNIQSHLPASTFGLVTVPMPAGWQ